MPIVLRVATRRRQMRWWLNVFFLVNGTWVPGHEFDGWSPREYATEQECLERKAFGERQLRMYPIEYESTWLCSQGRPELGLPNFLLGVEV
jgi:hypothetical protein